jgi:hypothetical protein
MSPESSDTTVPVVRLSDPADVVAGLPALFGFRPRESLMCLSLQQPRLRIGFCARADLHELADVPPAVAQLLLMAARNDATDVVVLAHSLDRGLAVTAAELLAEAFTDHDVQVRDVLQLDDHRFWSLRCDTPRCCPPEGRRYDDTTSRLVAEAVGSGRRIAGSRAELPSEVAAPVGAVARRMRRAVEAVRAQILEEHGVDLGASGVVVAEPVLRAGAAQVKQVVARAIATGPHRMSDVDAARLAVWCRCRTVRDVAWGLMDLGRPVDHFGLWTQVARRTVAPYRPAVLSLAGFSAWRTGDGARARCAQEEALAADPGYSMADLLGQLLDDAVPPWACPAVPEESLWAGADTIG